MPREPNAAILGKRMLEMEFVFIVGWCLAKLVLFYVAVQLAVLAWRGLKRKIAELRMIRVQILIVENVRFEHGIDRIQTSRVQDEERRQR